MPIKKRHYVMIAIGVFACLWPFYALFKDVGKAWKQVSAPPAANEIAPEASEADYDGDGIFCSIGFDNAFEPNTSVNMGDRILLAGHRRPTGGSGSYTTVLIPGNYAYADDELALAMIDSDSGGLNGMWLVEPPYFHIQKMVYDAESDVLYILAIRRLDNMYKSAVLCYNSSFVRQWEWESAYALVDMELIPAPEGARLILLASSYFKIPAQIRRQTYTPNWKTYNRLMRIKDSGGVEHASAFIVFNSNGEVVDTHYTGDYFWTGMAYRDGHIYGSANHVDFGSRGKRIPYQKIDDIAEDWVILDYNLAERTCNVRYTSKLYTRVADVYPLGDDLFFVGHVGWSEQHWTVLDPEGACRDTYVFESSSVKVEAIKRMADGDVYLAMSYNDLSDVDRTQEATWYIAFLVYRNGAFYGTNYAMGNRSASIAGMDESKGRVRAIGFTSNYMYWPPVMEQVYYLYPEAFDLFDWSDYILPTELINNSD